MADQDWKEVLRKLEEEEERKDMQQIFRALDKEQEEWLNLSPEEQEKSRREWEESQNEPPEMM